MLTKLLNKVKNEEKLNREEAFVLLTVPLDDLCAAADGIRRCFCGDRADMCGIISGKGGCGEDCKFCAQGR